MATAQYLAAVSASIGGLINGVVLGYSSAVAPLLTNDTSTRMTFSSYEFGWFSSVVCIGALVGELVSVSMMNYAGRRATMVVIFLPFVVGWGVLAGASTLPMLIIGRLITGACGAILTTVVPTYICEISSPERKVYFVYWYQLMVVIGILYVFALGVGLTTFRHVAVVSGIVTIVYSCLMNLSLESPAYLISIDRKKEARKALQYFRGSGYDIKEEYQAIRREVEKNTQEPTFEDLNKPYILKPLFIQIALVVSQQLTGMTAILFNLSVIFLAAKGTIALSISTVTVGIIFVFGTALGFVLVARFPRRTLLTVSSLLMALSLAALGTYFFFLQYLESKQDVMENIQWLPLTSLVFYSLAFHIGYGPIPQVMMEHLFYENVREYVGYIISGASWSSAFVVTATFQHIRNGMGDYGTFWIFACFCLTNAIFCTLVVPETINKSVDEIAVMFGAPESSTETEEAAVDVEE